MSKEDAAHAVFPHILVVIPTRDRPVDLGRCLESLLQVAYPSWELLIVDQSDGDATLRMAEAYQDRLPKLTYRRTRERGLCRARNIGLQLADTGVVAYLDDDCTVDPEWLGDVAAAFRSHPLATLIFGSVRAAPHDSRQVFVPAIVFERERIVAGSVKHADMGMGAGMYLWPARSPHRHRFDVHLGSGARWPAADDWDYAHRVIRSGGTLVLTPAIQVCHYGARSWQKGEAEKLVRGYAHAIGAMDMKMIRCGDGGSVARALEWIRSYLTSVLSAFLTTGRPRGLGAVAMYMRGLVESFLLPVDRDRCLYLTPRSAARRRSVTR